MTDAPVKGDKVSWEGTFIKKKFFGEVAEVLEDVIKVRERGHRVLVTLKHDRVHKE